MSLKIGVDMGGVCSSKSMVYEDDSKEMNVLIDVEDALKYLELLQRDGHELILVSFCGRRRANETRRTLKEKYKGLFDEVFFVKDKKYKKDICEFKNLDVMIDDRTDVLRHIDMPETHLINYVGDLNEDALAKCLKCTDVDRTLCYNWADTYKHISNLKSLKRKKKININKSKLLYT
jgi:hypothetical protein